MDARARAPYLDAAKKQTTVDNRDIKKEKVTLTCTGLPLNEIKENDLNTERFESEMKRYIEKTVRDSFSGRSEYHVVFYMYKIA